MYTNKNIYSTAAIFNPFPSGIQWADLANWHGLLAEPPGCKKVING
jgi:hypothetical protein